MKIEVGDIVKYKGERREVLSIHPDYGIDIGDISRVTPDEIEEVYSKPISGEITPGPWRWMFNGNAGNYFLVGNDGRGPFIGNGPHSADGELMRSAWEMQADLATLRAEVERLQADKTALLAACKSAHDWMNNEINSILPGETPLYQAEYLELVVHLDTAITQAEGGER